MINVYKGTNNVYRFGSYDEYALPPGCQPLDQANWLSCESASILHPSGHISTNRLYSAVHIGTRWKIQTEDKSKTDSTKTKYNPEKAHNIKHSETRLPWFSRLLRHSARKCHLVLSLSLKA